MKNEQRTTTCAFDLRALDMMRHVEEIRASPPVSAVTTVTRNTPPAVTFPEKLEGRKNDDKKWSTESSKV
jgi:hypothetical protein